MVTIRETKHVEDEKGVWLIIAADHEEALRAQVFPPKNKQPHMVSIWWKGSATAGTVGKWIGETIEHLPNTSQLECRIKIRTKGASRESSSYRIDNVGKIPDDIQRWADDGAVVCSIVNAPQNHEVIYMWAELRSEGVPHIGEVGLHYEANSLGTSEGKRVLSRLIRDTAARHLSGNDTDQLSNALAEKIFNSMKHLHAYRNTPS